MSYVVQSCCSIRVRNQLLKMVSDANAAWYLEWEWMQREDSGDLTKKEELLNCFLIEAKTG